MADTEERHPEYRAWRIAMAGQIDDALALFHDLRERNRLDTPGLFNMATLLLYRFQLSEALDVLEEVALTDRVSVEDTYLNMGVCHWLLRRPESAVESWHLARKALYAGAGGPTEAHGLLLFSTLHSGDQRLARLALKELKKVRGTLPTAWPIPVALYLTDRISETDLLTAANHWTSASAQRRATAQAYFYRDVHAGRVPRLESWGDLQIQGTETTAEYVLARGPAPEKGDSPA